MNIQETKFGELIDGRHVSLFSLSNDNNITIKITNYGCIVTSIETPDNKGITGNIVLGFDQLNDYLSSDYLGSYPYFGCIIGRCGNRIAGGKFTLEGKEYNLAINNGPNHLHGGLVGFDRKLWDAEILKDIDQVGVKLSYLSPDGEENYPGNLKVTCLYTLNNQNELGIEYIAETDSTTLVNLTNHTYFNLTCGTNNILGHELMLNAENITEAIDLIPTSKILSVAGTYYDFTRKKRIGKDLHMLPHGYDLNYVLGNLEGNMTEAGSLTEETTGRKVEVLTTTPGIQLYTGYWIPELEIRGEKRFGSYSGVALETQHYPDSIHHQNFPSVVLHPGKTYHQKTIYRFLTE